MNILLIDGEGGCGTALAVRFVNDGHTVDYYMAPKPNLNPKIATGIKGVTRIDNWVAAVKKADLITCTGNDKFLEKLMQLKDKGYPVYVPSPKGAELEIKRGVGLKFFEKHGLNVPEWKTFKTLDEAKAHVEKTNERYVFKTLGDSDDKSLSYVSKTPADMIEKIEYWKSIKLNPKGEVMLQKFVKGIEIAASTWVGKDGFVGKYAESFEHKKMYPGEVGVNTGEQGTLAKFVDNSKLADLVIKPLEKSLVEMGFLGDFDVNCIVDEDGKPWILEPTSRMGWPAMNLMLPQWKGDIGQQWLDAANGKDTIEQSLQVGIVVVLTIPPFPFSDGEIKETQGIPIYGIDKTTRKYWQPQQAMIGKFYDMVGDKPQRVTGWVTAGSYVGCVTGLGDSVSQAKERVYRTIDKISISNMGYRNDISDKCLRWIDTLKLHGFATDWDTGEN